MSRKDARLAALRAEIPRLSVEQAAALQAEGALLIDVRESTEVAQGSPRGALRLGRDYLELRIEDHAPAGDETLLLLCAGGVRSLFAAEGLRQLGYGDVRSVDGGFNAWKGAGLPFEQPRTLGDAERERYARHLLMPEVGEAGQLRLAESKVLLVGAGGLGSPAALYLAAAGVGTLGIIDDDVVDRSNLQRQLLHREGTVGQLKVESARQTLAEINPLVEVVAYPERLTVDNVERIFGDYDVVVDGSDNFSTRYLVNDACVKLEIPNVHGSIFRFEGQVSVFHPAAGDNAPCYRCLFPEPPPPELAPSCAEAGVLGVLPGVIGTLEAVETIKLLLGIGEPLIGKLLTYDALSQTFRTLKVSRDPDCPLHGETFPGYQEVAASCAVPALAGAER